MMGRLNNHDIHITDAELTILIQSVTKVTDEGWGDRSAERDLIARLIEEQERRVRYEAEQEAASRHTLFIRKTNREQVENLASEAYADRTTSGPVRRCADCRRLNGPEVDTCHCGTTCVVSTTTPFVGLSCRECHTNVMASTAYYCRHCWCKDDPTKALLCRDCARTHQGRKHLRWGPKHLVVRSPAPVDERCNICGKVLDDNGCNACHRRSIY